MELNGLANIQILMDQMTKELPNNDEVLVPAAEIYQQLELMNRYMVAYEEWVQRELKAHASDYHHVVTSRPPHWHEIKADPKKYPTARERMNGFKQEGQAKV